MITNLEIIATLIKYGFQETTSKERHTKSKRFKHPAMGYHVSIKFPNNSTGETTKHPLVIHPDDEAKFNLNQPDLQGVELSNKRAGGGSLKYDNEILGGAYQFSDFSCLQAFIKILICGSNAINEAAELAAHEIDNDPQCADISATERKTLINARIGQGGYRLALLKIWDNRCALTGCSISEVLVASHAKPWAICSNVERLDPYNGLLLSASVDKLFDGGLISFRDDGTLLKKPTVSDQALESLGIKPNAGLQPLLPKHLPYLKAHRDRFGF